MLSWLDVQKVSKLDLKHLIIECCHCVCQKISKVATKLPMTKHYFHLHLRSFFTNGWKMLYNLTYGTLTPQIPTFYFLILCNKIDSLH